MKRQKEIAPQFSGRSLTSKLNKIKKSATRLVTKHSTAGRAKEARHDYHKA
jgi:hypothetical protein